MRKYFPVFSALFFMGMLLVPALSRAEEENANFKYKTVTTKEGLVFRVPEDMPVEKRDGLLAPIPFDEYMYGKFKQVDVKLQSINEKLDRIEKKVAELDEDEPSVLSAD